MVGAVLVAGAIFGKSRQSGDVRAPSVRFGAKVQPAASPGLIDHTNGWVATSGEEAIAVYAGSQAKRHTNGLLVIARTTHAGRRITERVLRDTGAVTLLRPAPSNTESAALTATLRFVTASGDTGTLNLAGDTVTLSP